MNYIVQDRVEELAKYIIETKDTVRGAAAKFGVSKSTVHSDMSKKLKYVDQNLYDKVREILDENKSQRHIRGGLATKEKYEKRKSQKSK
ncbi:MAG: sporulation transcriptional regulator SpoIIID [Clostridia bacterium]